MKKIVLVNIDFKDAYTGKLHKAGDKVEMTDARIAEVKGVNPEFVSVIGAVEEPEQAAGDTKAADKDDKGGKKADTKAADKKSK